MEESSDNNLVSNHLILDGTEDVVLLDSAATISTDLTEITDELKKIKLRSAKDEDKGNSDGKDGKDGKDASNASNDNDDKKKDETEYDRNRKHKVLPVTTEDMKCELHDYSVPLIVQLPNICDSDH